MKDKILLALVEYIESEGCSCCENIDEHAKAESKLAVLLNVPEYKDGSGFDWTKAGKSLRGGTK